MSPRSRNAASGRIGLAVLFGLVVGCAVLGQRGVEGSLPFTGPCDGTNAKTCQTCPEGGGGEQCFVGVPAGYKYGMCTSVNSTRCKQTTMQCGPTVYDCADPPSPADPQPANYLVNPCFGGVPVCQ